MRIQFRKGEQRRFIKLVMQNCNCPSLRVLNQFGFDVPYSTLKNYFIEDRLLSEDLFRNLCHLAHLNPDKLDIKYLDEHWGQIKGGKKKKKL